MPHAGGFRGHEPLWRLAQGRSGTVRAQGATASLTPTEFRLLATLAAGRGKPLTRLELARAAWPHGAIVHDNTLDVYMARLRRKLRSLPEAPEIATVHGTGYRLQ